MKITVGAGANALEKMAIDDRLRALGVEVDPADRSVSESGLKGASVKRGMEGLAKAASTGGDKAVLDPDELSRIPVGFITGMKVSRAESKAEVAVGAAVQALRGASDAIESFLEIGKYSPQSVERMVHRILATASKVDAVTSQGVIGFTTPAQRNQLREELAHYASHAGALWNEFAQVMGHQVLPFIGACAQRYNEAGEEVGYGYEARWAAESAAGATRETLDYITHSSHILGDVHRSMIKCAHAYAADLLTPAKAEPTGPLTVTLQDRSSMTSKYWASDPVASIEAAGSTYQMGVVIEGSDTKAWVSKDGENAGVFPFAWVAGGGGAIPQSIPPDAQALLQEKLQAVLARGLLIKPPQP